MSSQTPTLSSYTMILPIIDFSVHAHLSSLHKTIKSINTHLEGITTGEAAANSDCEILATYRRVSSKSSQLKLIYFLDRGENSIAVLCSPTSASWEWPLRGMTRSWWSPWWGKRDVTSIITELFWGRVETSHWSISVQILCFDWLSS